MKISFYLICLVLLGLTSCVDDSLVYPYEEPLTIEVIEISFVDSGAFVDSLFITFSVYHQNAIGFYSEEVEQPFHEWEVVVDQNGDTIKPRRSYEPPFYSLKPDSSKTPLELMKIPGFGCSHTMIEQVQNKEEIVRFHSTFESFVLDTILVKANPFFQNLYIDFLDTDGHSIDFLSKFNFGQLFPCPDHVLRIPYLGSNKPGAYEPDGTQFSFNVRNKYEMNIKYSLGSSGLRPLFESDSFKVKLMAIDRQLHFSNVVESDYMTLDEILIH